MAFRHDRQRTETLAVVVLFQAKVADLSGRIAQR
jgi:hypothetical protein